MSPHQRIRSARYTWSMGLLDARPMQAVVRASKLEEADAAEKLILY